MKFGFNLARLQVPEWSAEYINYKGLKKFIKAASIKRKHGEEPDLAGFFFSLDRNLETVDAFYNRKYAEIARRVKLLNDRYGREASFRQIAGTDELEETIGLVLELRSQLRKLQWYGEVNRRGFVKILKKKDKKIPASKAQQRYLQVRVDPRPFANNTESSRDLSTVNTWLSTLGELKQTDTSSDTESTGSLSRTVTVNAPNIPKELLDDIEGAVKKDDANALQGVLEESQEYWRTESAASQKFLHHVLQRSISCFSKGCVALLLRQITTLEQEDDINKRNCLHRFVLSIARTRTQKRGKDGLDDGGTETNDVIFPAEAPNLQASAFNLKSLPDELPLSRSDDFVTLFQFLLENLTETQRQALHDKDALGRMPLHYAAQYGFTVMCEVMVNHMWSWNQFHDLKSLDCEAWQDDEGDSPLHLSVLGGHFDTTEYLLSACQASSSNGAGSKPSRPFISNSNSLLTTAAKADHAKLISLLVEAGADVNAQDEEGEVPLHTAARYGHMESVKVLLVRSTTRDPNVDIAEKTFAWTPIMAASVEGNLAVVELLADAGADIQRVDASGWNATEHAALRGHLDIADALTRRTRQHVQDFHHNKNSPGKLQADKSSSAMNRDRASATTAEPVKSFGHRYLTDESLVLVSLGSMDQRKNFKPVTLENIPLAEAHATQLDTALSVVVSASGATSSEPTVIDLPVNENISTDPIAFTAKDITKVKLLFDIVPTYSGSKDSVVGRGVALLSSVKPNIGSKRMNLQGDISVPIIASKTMEYIGTVNFNFLVITAFSHPNMSVSTNQTYWKSMTGPMVIGHRGMGKNIGSRTSLQLGENTLQSFIAAANLGANYVEFDVQLTKDHVPVIYHDFLVSETGIDAPVHTLTLEQFLHVNETKTPRGSRPPSPQDTAINGKGGKENDRLRRRERAQSLGAGGSMPMTDMAERMKHTRDFKLKGYKGNSRGKFIQAPFTTLEEMLRTLPEHIGFNIEMKYPMLFESEEHEMDTYAVELNSFVDTVLTMVYDHGKQRDIIFSSFNPDICLLLSFKQPSIPVLFLTDAGTSVVGDIRASSLQEAIRFASRWNLLGIVSAAEPLVTCPRLVRVVKESGLVCVSYGTLNNEPKNVKKQVDEGIDAVIVDSVLAIRQGLTHPSPHITGVPNGNGDEVNGLGDSDAGFMINGVPLNSYQYGAVV